MERHFTKGTIHVIKKLDKEQQSKLVDAVVDFANANDFSVELWVDDADSDQLGVDYDIVKQTQKECNALLKSMISVINKYSKTSMATRLIGVKL